MKLKPISKYMSLILRHRPEEAGITLDEHGWARVDELIDGIKKKYDVDKEIIEKIVALDQKQRFSFNDDKTLIRANQGHSINVDVELIKKIPPDILYHGTGEKYVNSIEQQGLIPKSRLYVHLSTDIDTAVKVGSRHGKPIVYEIDTKRMTEDNIDFYISVNGIWLVKNVPIKYMRKLDMNGYSYQNIFL